jgi:DNA-binding YbaB/EbfC family protein
MNIAMIKKMEQMQKEMKQVQDQMDASTFYGKAGGGAVEVEFTGDKKMQKINIDETTFELPQDLDILKESMIAAVNDCMTKIDEENEAILQQFSNQMGAFSGIFK